MIVGVIGSGSIGPDLAYGFLSALAAGEGGKAEDEPSPAEGLRRVDELRSELGRRLAALAAEEAGAGGASPHGDGLT